MCVDWKTEPARVEPLRVLLQREWRPNCSDSCGIAKWPVIAWLSATCCFFGLQRAHIFFILTPLGWLTNLWEVHSHVALPSLCPILHSALCHHGNTNTNYSHSVFPCGWQADLAWPFVDVNWRRAQVEGQRATQSQHLLSCCGLLLWAVSQVWPLTSIRSNLQVSGSWPLIFILTVNGIQRQSAQPTHSGGASPLHFFFSLCPLDLFVYHQSIEFRPFYNATL